MKAAAACESITDLREAIDALDRDLIGLIARRAEYVRAAARFKADRTAVQAEDRVAAMIGARRQWAGEKDLDGDFIEDLFRRLVSYFVKQEMKKWESENNRPGK